MSLTVTPSRSRLPAIRGAHPGTSAAAAPIFAADSRNSRLEIMCAPDEWLSGGYPCRRPIDHPESDELNDVIKSVVIEIDGMRRNLELLNGRADKSESESGHSPRQRGFTTAAVGEPQCDEKEHCRRQ